MTPPEKEKPSILGLGHGASSSDPNAWRPSKARAKDSGSSLGWDENQERAQQASGSGTPTANRDVAWRPSKVNEERLSSLLPAQRRRRLALPPRVRLILTLIFFIFTAYFFLKLWLMPEAGSLRPVLLIAAAVTFLLFVSAIVGVVARRRRQKSADDQSTLRLQ